MDSRKDYELYASLQAQLIDAYTTSGSQNGLIQRLTDELATVRRRIKRKGDDGPPPPAAPTESTIPDILLD